MNLKIYIVDSSNISLDVLLSSHYISDLEKLSFDKYKHLETKKEKIVSSILKNKYIGEYHIDDNGKPISKDKYFNISHSHSLVVLVIDKVPIGVDIEKIRPVEDDLINYVCNESEKSYVKDPETFFEIWTNKEALVKSHGTGVKQKPSEIPALPVNGVRKYKNKEYRNHTIRYKDFVITVSRCDKEQYNIKLIEEAL